MSFSPAESRGGSGGTVDWAALFEKTIGSESHEAVEESESAAEEAEAAEEVAAPAAASAVPVGVLRRPLLVAREGSDPYSLAGRDAIRSRLVWLDLDGRVDIEKTLESLDRLPVLDSDLAEVISDLWRWEACYVPDLTSYATWTGTVWQFEDSVSCVSSFLYSIRAEYRAVLMELYSRRAQEVEDAAFAAGLAEDDAKAERSNEEKRLRELLSPAIATATKMVGAAFQRAVHYCLSNLRTFQRPLSDFDVLPSLSVGRSCVLVVGNGWTDLGLSVARVLGGGDWSVQMNPFEAGLLVTQESRGVLWSGGGAYEGSMWKAYLELVWADVDTRVMLQRYVALCAMGLAPSEKLMLNLVGQRNSAKSLFLEVIKAVLGDYATSVAIASLVRAGVKRGGAEHNADLHVLRLARFITAAEPDEHDVWNTSLVKGFTGGDMQTTRGFREPRPLNWVPRGGIAVASNDWIKFPAGDEAMSARLLAARTEFTFASEWEADGSDGIPVEHRADPHYKARLLASAREREAVLEWILDGVRLGAEAVARGERWVVESAATRVARGDMLSDLSSVVRVIELALEAGVLVRVDRAEAVRGKGLEWCIGQMELRSLYFAACDRMRLPSRARVTSLTEFAKQTGAYCSGGRVRKTASGLAGRGERRVVDGLAWAKAEEWYRAQEKAESEGRVAGHWSVDAWLAELARDYGWEPVDKSL